MIIINYNLFLYLKWIFRTLHQVPAAADVIAYHVTIGLFPKYNIVLVCEATLQLRK